MRMGRCPSRHQILTGEQKIQLQLPTTMASCPMPMPTHLVPLARATDLMETSHSIRATVVTWGYDLATAKSFDGGVGGRALSPSLSLWPSTLTAYLTWSKAALLLEHGADLRRDDGLDQVSRTPQG